jgi:hypothetical protein
VDQEAIWAETMRPQTRGTNRKALREAHSGTMRDPKSVPNNRKGYDSKFTLALIVPFVTFFDFKGAGTRVAFGYYLLPCSATNADCCWGRC